MIVSENHTCRCWVYVRGYGIGPSALIRQMSTLLDTAEQRGFTVVGQSQEISSGTTLRRIGLQEALRAVRLGYANAILTHSVFHLSVDRTVLLRVLEIMQDHHAVLICTAEDTYTCLYNIGLSPQLYQRSLNLTLGLPWPNNDRNMEKDNNDSK